MTAMTLARMPSLPARSFSNPKTAEVSRDMPAIPTPEELDSSFLFALTAADPAVARGANAMRFQILSAQLEGRAIPQFDEDALRAYAMEVQPRQGVGHPTAISFQMRVEAARRLDAWCAEDLPGRNEARFLIMEAILDDRIEFAVDRKTGQAPNLDALRLKLEIENLLDEQDTWTELHAKCASILAGIGELEETGRGEPGLGLLKGLWDKLTEVTARCRDEAERDFVISLRAAVWRQRADTVDYYQGRRSFFPASFDCAHPQLPPRAHNELAAFDSTIRALEVAPRADAVEAAPPEAPTAARPVTLRDLLRTVVRTEVEAQEAEDAFLRCSEGKGVVDFSRLEARHAGILGQMPLSAWPALAARLPGDRLQVKLPNFAHATAAVMPSVVAGLATLPLSALTVALPGVEQRERLDLSGLPSSTQVIEFSGSQPEDSPLTVVVPKDIPLLVMPARSADVRILEAIGSREA